MLICTYSKLLLTSWQNSRFILTFNKFHQYVVTTFWFMLNVFLLYLKLKNTTNTSKINDVLLYYLF